MYNIFYSYLYVAEQTDSRYNFQRYNGWSYDISWTSFDHRMHGIRRVTFCKATDKQFPFEDGDPDKKILNRSIWVRPSQTDSYWQTFEKALVWGEEWH